MKSLMPRFGGLVKCSYADVPFNSQQAFEEYDDSLEHSQWLSSIYPTLELQRDLLADDGSLFLHIDDNELGNLLSIADEVFDARNRIAIMTFKQGAAVGQKAINPGLGRVDKAQLGGFPRRAKV